MNRFIFGRGWVCDETKGDGSDAGGGGGEGEIQDRSDDSGGAEDGSAVAGGKEEAPKDMKAAIDVGLGYQKGPGGEPLDPLTGKPKETPEKMVEQPSAGKETETHYANGKPKKNEKGEALDDKGQVVKAAPKPKTAVELDLKPEERKALHPKTQARFTEMISALKAHEGTIAALTETNNTLTEARDAILGVLEETHTTQDQLGAYLEFNRLLQSKDPKDLESALGMVEEQRAALYKVLGREPESGGLDLLAEFPDLQRQVDDSEITRAAALEIANGRRERAQRDAETRRQQQQQQQKTQSVEQQKQAANKALKDIEAWTTQVSKTDLDYKAKEDKLLSRVDGVLKSYPPSQWLPIMRLLYEGIEIQRAQAPSGKRQQPLRPSGAKPGAKAPTSMLEAINQGLGYAGE
jgi:hypothetical protein